MAENDDPFSRRLAAVDDTSGGDATDAFSRRLAAAAAFDDQRQKQKAALTPGLIGGTVRAIANGATFGFADKAQAALESALGLNYDQAIANQRQMDENFSDQHPVVNFGGELAGGLATGIPGAARMMAVTALPKAARYVGIGATGGALSGAGNTDGGIGNQLLGAAEGAGFGSVVGPAAAAGGNLLVKGASKIVTPVLDRFGSGPETAAARKLSEAMERDSVTPAQMTNRLQELGPNAAVVDAGGPNVLRLGETLASMPGAPAQQAEHFLEGRASGQGARLTSAVNDATGSNGGFYNSLETLVGQRKDAATPLYQKAFDIGPVSNDRINEFLKEPFVQQGIKQNLVTQRLESLAEGKPFNPHDFAVTSFNEAGDPIIGKVPNMRLLDAGKRGLDDMLETYRDKTTGKLVLDDRGRAIDKVRRAYVTALDEATARTPGEAATSPYAEARAAWSGPSQSLDALAMGRSSLKADPEVTAKTVGALSDADKEFFKVGVARALKDKIETTPDGSDAVRRIFGNQTIRDKLAAAFNDPASFEKFTKDMAAEATFANTRNQVLKGSQTARRLAGQQDFKFDPAPLVEAARGNFGRAALGAVRTGYNWLQQPPAGQAAQLGPWLFSPGASQEAIAATTNRLRAQGMTQGRINKLLPLLSLGAGSQAGGGLSSSGQ